jgi:restriction system protein
MAIPDFQSMMLPILELHADNKPHATHELYSFIVSSFNIAEDDQLILLPSGKQEIYKNRALWARTYLSKALLLESPERGVYKITDRGLQTLAEKPKIINLAYLKRFAEIIEFQNLDKNTSSQQTKNIQDIVELETPEETLDKIYSKLKNSLASELLDTIKTCSPAFFERLVVDLLTSMGYGRSIGESKVVGRSGDGGIDGIINEDKLGLESVYIQAKRWQGTVGDIEIRNFIGSLQLKGARKGVFITTSDFTRQARDSAAMITGIKIVLIDGLTLADLMIEYNVGVSVKTSYEIKRIDSDYFEE